MKPASETTTVRVLRNGYIVREGQVVVDASSTVTLVESASLRIVVDTGSPRERAALVNALTEIDLDPGSVRYVVNTHMHIDHCGCNDVFDSAIVVAHSSESPPIGSMKISEQTRFAPGIEVVPTPGHSQGSISLFVEADRRYAICGDAIPTRENYEKHVPPSMNVNSKLALRSLDAIASWTDIIVPGHGPPFLVLGKK